MEQPGSEAFRDRMSDLAGAILKGKKRESYTGEEVRRHDESAARGVLERGLEVLGIELANLRLLRQNDPRKQALAWLIRTKTVCYGPLDHASPGHGPSQQRESRGRRVPLARSRAKKTPPTQIARTHGPTPFDAI